MGNTPLPALQVAKYLVNRITDNDDDAGDAMTNLRLQKLLYYVQGFSLAILNRPMFQEDIERWMYGPVVPAVYDVYKKHKNGAIPSQDVDYSVFSDEDASLINDVFNVYGQYSAIALMHMTHREPPWRDADDRGVITHESLRDYFLTQTTDG